MKVTREAVIGLSFRDLERLLSLARYHRTSVLLEIHANEAWEWLETIDRNERAGAFLEFFRPYYELWIASVYMVHEGFVDLGIEDERLKTARRRIDFEALRRFRNATFHFQAQFKSEKHGAIINAGLTSAVSRLHERHGIIIRRLMRYIKFHPKADAKF